MLEQIFFFGNRIHGMSFFIGRDIENRLMCIDKQPDECIVRLFVISMDFLNEGFEKLGRLCLIESNGTMFVVDGLERRL